MPIDPQIAQYNPMANYIASQKAMADIANTEATTEHTQAQVPLIKEQTRSAGLANAQSERDLKDQQIAADAWKESNGDPTKLIQGMVGRGASPKAVMSLQGSLIQQAQQRAAATLEQNKVFNEQHQRLGGLMEGVQAAGAPGTPQRQAAWDDATKTAIQEGLARPGDYPAQAPDDDWITRKVNGARMIGGIAAAAAQKQEVATKAAQAAKDTAEAAKASGEKTLMDMKLNLMKGLGADSIDNAVNSLADPKQFPDANNAMNQAGRLAMASGDPEKVNAAILGLYEKMVIPNLASTVAADTAKKVAEQKALLPGEVDKARQLAPIHIGEQVQAEIQKARLASGTGQIVDPRQRGEVDHILSAADKEAEDKISEAMRLKGDIQMARAGNRVSPNLETIETLRGIVNRVNTNELKQVGGSGSAIDWLKGSVGKWTEGQPIPANIQNDFESIANANLKLAQNKLGTVYGTVAEKYKLRDLQPPDIAGVYSRVSGGSGGSNANRPPLSSFEKK